MEEEKKLPEQTQDLQAPGEYSSAYQNQLSDAIGKILDQKDFSYDVNGDALYQQYKDRYVQGGKMAMMDTLGQASALTGGYGNSYAQAAGQQAYQGYLQGLNDKIPELYQLALNNYDRKTDALYKRYSLLSAQEGQDYDRYENRYQQEYNQNQQSWENAFRLYQLGVRTPAVLGVLGIPEETGGSWGSPGSPNPNSDDDDDDDNNGGNKVSLIKEASKAVAKYGQKTANAYIQAQTGGAKTPEARAALQRANDIALAMQEVPIDRRNKNGASSAFTQSAVRPQSMY